MAATLFSTSLSPQFLSLPSSSSSSPKPAPSAFFPSKLPQLRALVAAGWRHSLAPLAVAVSSDVDTEDAEESSAEFSEDLRVFVGNLPFSVDSAQLAGLFEQAGSVEMVEVIYDKLTGRSRGFGFVTMSTVEEVEDAVEQLNGYVLDGRTLKVNSGPPPPRDQSSPRGFREQSGGFREQSGGFRQQSGGFRQQSSRGPSGGDNRVYVGNLSWNVDDAALQNLFSKQGSVLAARVIYDRESGRSRGFGFVSYGSSDEVERAVSNLDGADLDGRQIRVTVAEARQPRREY
ncbi:RNA-binding protein CP29B, chloroplastic-like [Lolium rigidum]|uniref:RNA-binding protein CP29B, chloroplastic-like n=1 Tax=Lolium rigidum TaxID=89674 RepID=UPI001F5C5C09|nr:RNA-binding protein CP29B, chloroplastic-like [Lolium rigidum]